MTTRIRLTDGSGRWFDADKAEVFAEDTDWNGQNRISRATGSQWEHQRLYRTAQGRWILHTWSQWQGAQDTIALLTDEAAHRWLLTNGHPGAVPDAVVDAHEL